MVGAFCNACYRELVNGKIPNVLGHKGNKMGSRARLRTAQDNASRRAL